MDRPEHALKFGISAILDRNWCPPHQPPIDQHHHQLSVWMLHPLPPILPIFPTWSAPPSDQQTRHHRQLRRAVFSDDQRRRLEARFQLQKYITKPDRKRIADQLGLKDSQVKIWFQNRRMKQRNCKQPAQPSTTIIDQQQSEAMDEEEGDRGAGTHR